VGIASFAYPSIAVNRCNDVWIGYSSLRPDPVRKRRLLVPFASDPPTRTGRFCFKAGRASYFKDLAVSATAGVITAPNGGPR